MTFQKIVNKVSPVLQLISVDTMNEKLSYSIQDAIEALGVSRQKIYNEMASGRLKSFRIGRRRFVAHGSIIEYINDRVREAAEKEKEAAASMEA